MKKKPSTNTLLQPSLTKGADEKLDSAKILDMLSISDDGSVSIDDAKVTKYVQQLASKYNTFGRKRSFKTSSGDTIEIGGGDYGWVVSKKKEKAQLLSDLEGSKPVEREPVYEQTALYRGADDIGNTYIEIDYTKQHMWYYKDGALQMESDFVSEWFRRWCIQDCLQAEKCYSCRRGILFSCQLFHAVCLQYRYP